MKIKITGKKELPKAWGGLDFTFKKKDCPDGQKKNPLTGMCEPIPDFGASNSPQIKTDLGDGFIRNPETNLYGKPADTFNTINISKDTTQNTTSSKGSNNPFAGVSKASMAVGIMGMANNLIEESQKQRDYKDYMRRLGSTDASNPVVKNAYSRGRNVMNTPAGADYAPNMMTPVQFAGRPVSEYLGYPTFPYNRYGRDGLLVAGEGGALFPDRPSGFSEMPVVDYMPYTNYAVGPQALGQQDVQAAVNANNIVYSGDTPESVENTNSSSGYVLPVSNFRLTSGYGTRKAPQGPHGPASTNHNGVDLAVKSNSPVYSPTDGVVSKIYYNDAGGKQLIIKNADGTTSGFAHLNDYKVAIGDKVSKGDIVALSGNTGNSNGPHLHFTFRNASGDLVNPADYFNITTSEKQAKGVSNYDHNNPGNIHIGNFAKGYGATKGRKDGDGYVAIFPNPQVGMKAMEDLVFGPKYANLSISQARNKWVNGDPGTSSTSTPYIVKSLGGDYKISDLSPAQRKKLISEFVKWEDRKVYNRYKQQGLVFEEGGEYELDDDEINYILANGGTVEYL